MPATPYSVVLTGGVTNKRTTASAEDATLHHLYLQYKKPVTLDLTVEEYQALHKKERSRLKMGLPYFVGAVFDPPTRSDDNVRDRTLLTMDVERKTKSDPLPPAPDEVASRLKAVGSEGWVYTSVSHTPDDPRYRVVLPLGKFIQGGSTATETLKATTQHAARKLGIEAWVDSISWNLSQPMYAPAKLADGEFKQWYVKGKAWAPQQATRQRVEVADIPGERPDFVLQAIKQAGLYLRENPQHKGMHFITCPFSELHTTTSETKTAYYEAHFDGNPRPAVKCMGTGPDTDGTPHLTFSKLVRWLTEHGFLDRQEQDKVGVLDDFDKFEHATRLSTILQTPPPLQEWAIEHFAPIGSVTMLAAPGGQGKSLLMLHVAMYGALGIPFGAFKVDGPLRTLYVSYEDSKRIMYDRIVDIGQELREHDDGMLDALYDVDGSLNNNLSIHKVDEDAASWVFLVKPDRFTPAERTSRVNWLVDYLKQRSIRMVVFDPMVYTHQLQENDIADMAFYMQTLNYIATQARCAIIVIHHMSKMGRAETIDDLDQHSLRGASSITDNARSAGVLVGLPYKDAAQFGIEEADVRNYAIFKHVKSNYAAPLPLMVFERRGRTLRYRPEIKKLDQAHIKEAREQRTEQNRIAKLQAAAVDALRVLADHDGPISQNQVAIAADRGWNPQKTKAILEWCEQQEYTEAHYEGERRASKHTITALGRRYLKAQQ